MLLLRKLQNWAPHGSFAEYWSLQLANNLNTLAIAELEKMTKDIEKFAIENFEIENILPRGTSKCTSQETFDDDSVVSRDRFNPASDKQKVDAIKVT